MLCNEAKIVVLCLLIHLCVTVKVILLTWAVPEGFDEVQILILIISTGVGFVCARSSVRKQGSLNTWIGAIGLRACLQFRFWLPQGGVT